MIYNSRNYFKVLNYSDDYGAELIYNSRNYFKVLNHHHLEIFINLQQ